MHMANADYDAKFMRWIYKYLPYIGAFMLFGLLLVPVVNLVRYSTGEKMQEQFVSKVRCSTSNPISPGSVAGGFAMETFEHALARYRPDRLRIYFPRDGFFTRPVSHQRLLSGLRAKPAAG